MMMMIYDDDDAVLLHYPSSSLGGVVVVGVWVWCTVAWKEIVCDDTTHKYAFYFIINEPIHGKSDGCFCLFDTDIDCRQ